MKTRMTGGIKGRMGLVLHWVVGCTEYGIGEEGEDNDIIFYLFSS